MSCSYQKNFSEIIKDCNGNPAVNITTSCPIPITQTVNTITIPTTGCAGPGPNVTVKDEAATKVAIVGSQNAVPVCIVSDKREDAMITCVAENANLYVIDWDNDTNSYKIYDFSGNDVTGTVTPVKCEDTEITTVKELVCDGGTTPLWQHTVYTNGNINNVYYTTITGFTPVIPAGTITVGACPSSAPVPISVVGGSLGVVAGPNINSISGGAFFGAPTTVSTASITGLLQSITVKAQGVSDGYSVGSTQNQVIVTTPSGNHVMFDGEVTTWSVVKDKESQLAGNYVIQATGSAYANITYTSI